MSLHNLYNSSSYCLAILVCLVVLSSALYAQESELVTDRPDQTESASTVPTGRVQIEAGVSVGITDVTTIADADPLLEIGAPEVLVRVGVHEIAEIRVAGALLVQNYRPAPEDIGAGLGDIAVGGKIRLLEGYSALPQIALLAHLTLPVGSEDIAPDNPAPDVRLAFAHDLGGVLSLGYNIGGEWNGNGDFESLYTLALGLEVSSLLGFFVELYGNAPWEDISSQSFDSGITWLLQKNVQLDLASGFGLSDAAQDLFIGLGLSVRIPE